MRVGLELGEFLVERGDARRTSRAPAGLSVSSIWASERVLSSSSSSTGGWRAALDHVLVVLVGVGLGLVGDLFLFLDGRAGGLLADLAFGAFAAFLALGDLLGGRALGQHRLEVEDLAQLHAAFVEGVRPFDDGVEGDRAFAQAPDHGVAAGLDALGDGDLALAGEQFHRAHLAQVHADRIVGAVDRFLLGRPRPGAGRRRRADRPRPRARARPSPRPRRRRLRRSRRC